MSLHNRPKTAYRSFLKRVTTWTVICALPLVVIFFFSRTAHAGLLSFVNSMLGGEQASAKTKVSSTAYNTQNLMLLQAHTNIHPTAELAVDTLPIDDGETLLPDIASINATSTDDGSAVISTYVVRSGDTLSGIAQMFNVSVNTLLWANDISRSAPLQAGQTLVILPVSGISYTVKKGDTVSGIVAKFKADTNEVLRFNDLTLNSALTVGQTIIIPDAELATPVAPPSSSRIVKHVGNEPLLDGWNWPAIVGYFIRPILGGVKSQNLHGHNAVDLAAPVGTIIRASAAGTVIISRTGGYNGGYGTFVVISHPNGTQTLYAHMSRTAVKAGDSVGQGQTIGYIGMTGLTTGPHVHFEIRGAQNPF